MATILPRRADVTYVPIINAGNYGGEFLRILVFVPRYYRCESSIYNARSIVYDILQCTITVYRLLVPTVHKG